LRAACRRLLICLCLPLLWLGGPGAAQPHAPVVLAAASLQEALGDAADAFAAAGHPRPVLSFAASPALARQIEAGAPADLFISADMEWMDHVERRGLIARGTRTAFLGNRLVLVAPAASPLRLAIRRGFPLAQALGNGRLAMADPDSVPAGRYGRAALKHLGVWESVSGRITRAENVRAALMLVARGEAPLGIVYATDAAAAKDVRVVATFPEGSHPPIRYPVARLARSTDPEAEAFRRFLVSPAAMEIFRRRGFVAP